MTYTGIDMAVDMAIDEQFKSINLIPIPRKLTKAYKLAWNKLGVYLAQQIRHEADRHIGDNVVNLTNQWVVCDRQRLVAEYISPTGHTITFHVILHHYSPKNEPWVRAEFRVVYYDMVRYTRTVSLEGIKKKG